MAGVLTIGLVGPATVASVSGAFSRQEAPAGVLYVSPAGSDSGACTRSKPCQSLDHAYRLAKRGQAVELAGGKYPSQTMEADASRLGTRDVVFRPATGAAVEILELTVHASHLEFRDIATGVWKVREGADDVTFRRVDTSLFFITSASNVSVIGGDVGPAENSDSQIKTDSLDATPPNGILIDGVYFHDIVRTDPRAHTECLQIMASNGLTIRNSRFRGCATHDIFVAAYLAPVQNVLIENNWFDKSLEGYYSLSMRACNNVLIRNNTALQNMYVSCRSGATNVRVESNIQPTKTSYHCSVSRQQGVVWDWNVYESGTPCGSNDLVAPVSFVNRKAFDLHLTRGAVAIGKSNRTSFPARDIDGNRRPNGLRADAGADEFLFKAQRKQGTGG